MVDWITIDKNSGNSGTTVITVTASSYQELLERTTSLTVNTVNTSLSGSVAIIQQPRDVETVSVSPSTISAPASGGVYTFNIISNGAWTIEYPEWVTLSQTAGTGNATITVVVSENHSVEEYEDNIDVSTRDNTATVVVSQDRIVTHISVDPELLYFYESGGSKTITITSNAPWTASTNSEWISLSQSAGTGNGTVTVTCNSSSIDRNTSISFVTLDETASTEVRQYKEEPYLYFTQSAMTFDGNGGTKPLVVESNVQWEISSYDFNSGIIVRALSGGTFNINSGTYKYILNYGTEQTTSQSISINNGDVLIITEISGRLPSIQTTFNYTVEGRITDSTFDIDYNWLFRNSTGLTDASKLEIYPTTKSLNGMFSGCTNLVTPPTLPATTLTSSCYAYMFAGCSSLTTAPVLPATTMADSAYTFMFNGCTSLTNAPALPATTLADECYEGMFQNCSGLTTAPALPATTLADKCYQYMFAGCSSLTTAPTLPATAMTYSCYRDMFESCSSLTTAPELPATTLANYCYAYMFVYCTSLTQAPELPATNLTQGCYQEMFGYCSSLTTAPALPATTLVRECYNFMFSNCANLAYIKCLATDISASNCTGQWVNGVQTNSGVFVKNPEMDDWVIGDYIYNRGIPANWTVIDNTD